MPTSTGSPFAAVATHDVAPPTHLSHPDPCVAGDGPAEPQPAYLEVTITTTFVVAVDDRSDLGITGTPADEPVEVHEEVRGWLDQIAGNIDHLARDVTVDVHDDLPWHDADVISHNAPPRRLWMARDYLSRATATLARARYQEGHCPEVDRLARELDRFQDRLRVMAEEVDTLRAAGASGVIHHRPDPSPTAAVQADRPPVDLMAALKQSIRTARDVQPDRT